MAAPVGTAPDRDTGPTRIQRMLVLGALALLLVGGLAEIEAWPLTAWRLFSESRRAEQSGIAIQAVDEAGDVDSIRLGDLPLGFRMAGWPLGELPRAPSADGTALCRALLSEVQAERPDTEGLRILRTRHRLVERDGRWSSVEVSTDAVARCGAEAAP